MTPTLGKLLRAEISDEVRAIRREPTALFFSILMPVGFFALFVSIFGRQSDAGTSVGTAMLATFGTFGAITVTMMNPGIGVARDREIGWLRAKRVAAVPIGVTLTAKLVATIPYTLGMFAAMVATAAATGALHASVWTLSIMAAVLVVGSMPFALFGLTVGFRASSNASAAILNAVLMPCAVLSGLWLPLAMLPEFLQRIAPWLPTYHLGRLALAELNDGPWLGHAAVLLACGLALALPAALAYRHARP